MSELINELLLFIQQSEIYLKPWLAVLGIIWCVNILNWIVGSPLNALGIYPRKLSGLIGIFFSPILHRNFTHLFFNTIPLFFLGFPLLVSVGVRNFCWITLVIAVVGGLGVWCFARKGLHIGASSIISGYFGYILMTAYKSPSLTTLLLAAFVIYYFGGIFLGLFPKEKHVSWEGHLFGFLSGILCVYLPNLLPLNLFLNLSGG